MRMVKTSKRLMKSVSKRAMALSVLMTGVLGMWAGTAQADIDSVAATFVASANSGILPNGAQNITSALTFTAASKGMLVVTISGEFDLSSAVVTYNSTPMTLAVLKSTVTGNPSGAAAIYYLLDPTGTLASGATLSITPTTAAFTRYTENISYYKNIDSLFATSSGSANAGTVNSGSITASTGALLIGSSGTASGQFSSGGIVNGTGTGTSVTLGNPSIGGSGSATAYEIATSGGTFSNQRTAGGEQHSSVIAGFSAPFAGPTWAVDSDGNWTTPGNWSDAGGTFPSGTTGANRTAVFGSAILAPHVVTLDAPQSINNLVFNNATSGYTISGPNTLTLGGTAPVVIGNAGDHNIQVTLAMDANVTFKGGAGNITVSGNITETGGARSLTKSEAGTLTLGGANAYTGATNVTGGTLAVTGTLGNTAVNLSGGTLSLQSAGAVSQNTLTISGTGTLTQTLANAIGGTAALAVTGGSVTLAQDNNYSGGTIVSGGKLLITGGTGAAAGSGSVAINTGGTLGGSGTLNAATVSGGTIAPQVTVGTASTLTVNNLTVNDGSTYNFNLVGAASDKLVANTLTLNGTQTLKVAGIVAGTYEVIHYNTSLTGTPTINVAASHALSTTLLAPGAGGNTFTNSYSLTTSITANAWTGAVNGTWDYDTGSGATANWAGPSGTFATGTYSDGSPVLFDDFAARFNINITAPVAPASISFYNNANTYIIGGTIGYQSTNIPVTLYGTGKVIFTGPNDYTGFTTINTGATLQIGNGGTSGQLNATGLLNGYTTVVNNGTLAFNRSDVYTFGNPINGAGAVVMNGTGTLQLYGPVTGNTYTGSTIVNSGVLQFKAAGDLGDPAGSGQIIIGDTSGSANATLASAWDPNTTFAATRELVTRAGSSGIAQLGINTNGRNSMTFNGPVTLNKDLVVMTSSEQSSSSITFNGTLTGTGGIIHRAFNGGSVAQGFREWGYYPIFTYTNVASPTHAYTRNEGGLTRWTRSAATPAGGESISFGGDITLAGNINIVADGITNFVAPGDFELRATQTGTDNNAPVTLTNNIHVSAGGGGLYGWQSNGTNKPNITFSGAIDLAGPLTIGSRYQGDGADAGGGLAMHYTGTVTIDQQTAGPRSIQYQKSSAVASQLEGNIVDGAGTFANPLVLRTYGKAVQFNVQGTANTYGSGTIVEGSVHFAKDYSVWPYNFVLQPGLVNVAQTSSLGGGNVIVMPAGKLRVSDSANIATGKKVLVEGNSVALGVLSLGADFDPTAKIASASAGVLALDSTTYATNLDLALLGNGQMRLGAMGTATTYTGTSLGASAGTYRLGGGGGTLTISGTNDVLAGGSNNLEVGASGTVMFNGAGTIILGNANSYGGSTTVNRGSTLQGAAQAVGTPFGSASTAVNLNGGKLNLTFNAVGTTTNVGAITVNGWGQVGVTAGGAGNTVLNAASLSTVTNWSAARTSHDVAIIDSSVNGTTSQFTLGSTTGMPTIDASHPTLPGAFIVSNNTAGGGQGDFAMYNDTANSKTGFSALASTGYTVPDATWSTITLGTSGGTQVVDNNVGATLAAGDVTVYGLKMRGQNLAGGATATVHVGAGGLILTGNNAQIQTNVDFGSNEGFIYTSATGAFLAQGLTGTNGLTISGPGSLYFGGRQNSFSGITGTVTVHQTTVIFNALCCGNTADSTNYAFDGATFSASDRGDFNFAGTLNLLAGGLTLNGSTGGSTPDGQISGKITGTGTLFINPNYHKINITNVGNDWTGGTIVGGSMAGDQYDVGAVIVTATSKLGTGPLAIVSSAPVVLQGTGNLASSSAVSMVTNSTLYLQAAGTWTVASIEGGGKIVVGTNTGTHTLVVGDSTDRNFYGSITQVTGGTAGLTKNGSGTLTLSSANTYTGLTTVNNGKLSVVGSLASPVSVAATGTLGGTGTIASLVTVAAGGILAPGTSAGTITLNGGLTLTTASLNFELGAVGSSDKIQLGSSVLNATGTSTFNFTDIGGFGVGTYTLLDYGTLGTATLGSFALASPTLSGFNLALADDASAIVLLVTSGSGPIPVPTPASGVWKNGSSDGLWTTNTEADKNWAVGQPGAAGNVATFDDSVLSVSRTVTLNGAKVVGGIALAGSGGGYTIGTNADSLTLNNGAGTATITAGGSNSHIIAAPVITASNTNVSVSGSASLNLSSGITNNTNTLTLSNAGTGSLNAGVITGTGIGSTVVSAGTASATSISQNSLSIAATAALKITPTNTPNTAASTSVLSSLTIAGSTGNWSGQLDMGNNSLVIKNGGAAVRNTVADEIRQGMGLSTTIDPGHHGITSSTALTNVAGDTTLGYAVASDIQLTGTFAFAGQTVGDNDVLVKYTWKADANLDGIVNVADLGILATNYGLTDKSWVTADFNGDGLVNVADLGLLATYYGRGTSPSQSLMSFQDAMAMFPQFGGTGSVPEPTSLGLLGLGAVGLLTRRRRK